MNNLSENFEETLYGLQVRLVKEIDAEYIVGLRTDKKLSRFIHPTDNSVDKQVEWIKEYKKREKEGKEYYFIYLKDNQRIGVNRIYNIDGNRADTGSWLCSKGLQPYISIATLLSLMTIFFKKLKLEDYRFDIRKDNINVIKIHNLLSPKLINETELNYYYRLDESAFDANKFKLERFIPNK